MKSVIYMIRHINHGFKCTTFSFSKDNQILFTAKLKENNIYILVKEMKFILDTKILILLIF